MRGSPASSGAGSREAVMITGASSGIGKTCALALATEGFRVFAGVRNEDAGEELKSASSERIVPVELDVTDPESIERAEKRVREALPPGSGLCGLVNNAGITIIGPLEILPLSELQRQFEVNVLGVVSTTQTFLPLIRASRGRIVNMGSLTGRLSFPFAGQYSASKAAVAAMTDSLRLELAGWGIRVSLIEPGNIQTSIWDKHVESVTKLQSNLPPEKRALYKEALAADVNMVENLKGGGTPPEAVAKAVFHALTSPKPKTRYLVGNDARMLSPLLKIIPDKIRDTLVSRFMKLP
ncbi:MAG: SDR family oxidoreductase [Rubrobacteraceae bacterium]